MKKILILCVAIAFTACMKKEVEMGNHNLELKGLKLYYKEKPFTGTLIQKVPLTEDRVIKIQYKDGVIVSE